MRTFRSMILLLVALLSAGPALAETAPGVEVTSVSPLGIGDRAGVRVGDRVVEWWSGDESGVFLAPVEFSRLETLRGASASVRLTVMRDGGAHLLELPTAPWDVRVTIPIDEEVPQQEEEATRFFRELAAATADPVRRAALLWRGKTSDPSGALGCESRLAAWRSGDRPTRSLEWIRAGYDAFVGRELEGARDAFQQAVEIERGIEPEGLGFGEALFWLGRVHDRLGEEGLALAMFEQIVEIRERLAPGSLALAKALDQMALAAERQDLEEEGSEGNRVAEVAWQRADEIVQRWNPESMDGAILHLRMATAARHRGDLATSVDRLERARDLFLNHQLSDEGLWNALNSLGNAYSRRGRLDQAEAAQRQALELIRRLAPGTYFEAISLDNLGVTLAQRGDDDGALEVAQKALEIRLPEGNELALAMSYEHLGHIERRRGDLERAIELYEKALAYRAEFVPGSVYHAGSLRHLGRAEIERGDRDSGLRRLEEALAINRAIAPESHEVATDLTELGEALASEAPERALPLLEEARAIRHRAAPGSHAEAEIEHAVGRLQRSRGELQLAWCHFERAVEVLEQQLGMLGGSDEERAVYRADQMVFYRDLIEVLLELGRPEAAFEVLERSRARQMLRLLGERELVFRADLPADLDLRRRRLALEYEETQAGLRNADNDDDWQAFREQLETIRGQRDQVFAEIRKRSPELARLVEPPLPDLAALTRALDAGTTAIGFARGEGKLHAFVVRADEPLLVRSLDVDQPKLTRDVAALRAILTATSSGGERLLDRLGKQLLAPLADVVDRSDRLLLIPDGPLHYLPLAALPFRGEPLVAGRPVHVVSSLAVYAELVARRERAPAEEMLAFGDPDTNALREDDLVRAAAVTRGFELGPLPNTRREIEEISNLFGSHSRVFLGPDATESRVKSLEGRSRVLHFATHGLVDDLDPLDSSLVLTPDVEGDDNGFLQAWEIFEDLRLEADLVVLSACETALGKELDGEGILGLSRAFQFAGARSVVATLWSVPDRATADLMTVFYRELEAGQTPDEALRRAQLELRSRTETNHPFYWAGFQLIGDWR